MKVMYGETMAAANSKLSEYVGMLLQYSDVFLWEIPFSHAWNLRDEQEHIRGFTDMMIEQLGQLTTQTANSQVLMLSSAVSERIMEHVYCANGLIQILLQREQMYQQLCDLRILKSDCDRAESALTQIKESAKNGLVPAKVLENLDSEHLDQIVVKSKERRSRVEARIDYLIRGDGSYIGTVINGMCEDLVREEHKFSVNYRLLSKFGLLDLPFEFDKPIKYTDTLKSMLELYRQYAGYTIDPNQKRPYGNRMWDMVLAKECEEYQENIQKTALLLAEYRDVHDMRMFIEALVKAI